MSTTAERKPQPLPGGDDKVLLLCCCAPCLGGVTQARLAFGIG